MTRRHFLGRAAALGLTISAATSTLASCVRAAGPQRGGTLVLALAGGSTTDSLDPALMISAYQARFWGETLTEVDPLTRRVIPVLVESIEPDADYANWALRLRRHVTFHDGRTMTADDVVGTLRRHAGPGSRSGALGLLRSIAEMAADGAHVVRIRLWEPDVTFPYTLSDYHLLIQPGGGVDAPTAGIGTGPYRFESVQPGVRTLASKYGGHWRDGIGHTDAIEFLSINDSTARVSALHSGRAHIINRVEPKTVRLLERFPDIVVENGSGGGHCYFALRCDQPPFDNADLRLALKYAVDREELLKRVLHGFGSVGNDHPLHESYPLFDGGIEQRKYDPERARFHFRRSGHSGPLVLTTSDAAFAGAIDASVLYQRQAARCGIDIRVHRAPDDGYWTNVWNVNPFSAAAWGARPTENQMFSLAYQSTADWNHMKWSRPDFDRMLVAARREPDSARRASMYREMAIMVRDDGGAIIPIFSDFIDARSERVGGYVPDPTNQLSDGFASIRCWLIGS